MHVYVPRILLISSFSKLRCALLKPSIKPGQFKDAKHLCNFKLLRNIDSKEVGAQLDVAQYGHATILVSINGSNVDRKSNQCKQT